MTDPGNGEEQLAVLQRQVQALQLQLQSVRKNDSSSSQGEVIDGSEAGASHHGNQVFKVAPKLPPFWADNPTVWFAQAEAQFELSGISCQTTKYSYIIAQLDTRFAAEISDIIVNPPKDNCYDKLKSELIRRFSTSEEQRVRQLLNETDLGDRKPSQFLRYLRSLAGVTFNNDKILRPLWLSRLPKNIQAILAAQTNLELDSLADSADRIMEVDPPLPSICAASTSNVSGDVVADLIARVEQVARDVAALKNDSRRRSGSPAAEHKRPRSSSPGSRLCWYHRRFNEKAAKCIQPCSWNQGNRISRQ